jgi:hypothetical protein
MVDVDLYSLDAFRGFFLVLIFVDVVDQVDVGGITHGWISSTVLSARANPNAGLVAWKEQKLRVPALG